MPLSVTELAEFAAGITTLEAFRERVIAVLIKETPRLSPPAAGTASAELPLIDEWTSQLDVASDPADPDFDEDEARSFAGRLCAIIDQLPTDEERRLVSPLAVGAPRTTASIARLEDGRMSREDFERFVSRRSWPSTHRDIVSSLELWQLGQIRHALENNDFRLVASVLGAA